MTAGQRLRAPRSTRRSLPAPPAARNPVYELFLWSRLAIWAAALFALYVFQPDRNPLADRWDGPVFHDLGSFTDVWARWDSGWFLRIAEHGYHTGAETAFYPLYPGLLAALGRVFGGHYVIAGIAISLAASLGAFLLLYRIAEERLGADGARRAVLYLAFFPMALFLQAVYSESLYLLLSIAVFVVAERRRFVEAALLAGLAMLTRSAGIALLAPLVLMAWRSPRRARSLASVAIAPAMFAVLPLLLWQQTGDPWGFARSQGLWHRHLSPAGPLGGVWSGLSAGWAGVRQLASGSHTHLYWTAVGAQRSDPMRTAAINLEYLAFLTLFVALTIVAWRRFGAPYGLFAAVSLAIPLSVPAGDWPLLSIPRFGLGVFPFFLALAALGSRPRVHTAILSVSAVFLGVAIVQWSLWQWVS